MNKKMKILFLCVITLSNIFLSSKNINNDFSPVSYDITFDIDYNNEKLSGKCRLTIKSEGNNDTLPILLYRLLKVNSVTDVDGVPLNFTQKVVSFSDFEPLQVNYVRINTKNASSIVIEYSGYIFGYSETGMNYIKDNVNPDFTIIRDDCLSYPIISKPSFPSLRAGISYRFNYLVKVTIPDTLFAANGGLLVSKESLDGKSIFTYRNIKPAWRIDICIAKYNVIDDMGLSVYYFPEDSEGASNLLSSVIKSYRLYSEWFGDLKNPGYSIIEIPDGWGSQTDVTCIIQSAGAFKSNEKLDEVYHEISHIWNLNSTDSMPCRVESEGLATFLQFLVKEKLTGRPGITDSIAGVIITKMRIKFSKDADLLNTAMIDFGKKNMTTLSYTKGMLFFYLFYKISGEAAFFNTIRNFYQAYRTTGATTNDLTNMIIDQNAEKSLNLLVKDWIYSSKSSEMIMKSGDITDLVDYYKNIN